MAHADKVCAVVLFVFGAAFIVAGTWCALQLTVRADGRGCVKCYTAKAVSSHRTPNSGLDEFFVGVEFAVFGGVVEGNVAVGAFFELIDFAGVEGLGVNVDADGALIVFGEIEDLVDGFEGIYVNRI